ncbi:MAG: hypothetical protein ACE3L7_01525 [Candidatus Pristimantibacillus sp.]
MSNDFDLFSYFSGISQSESTNSNGEGVIDTSPGEKKSESSDSLSSGSEKKQSGAQNTEDDSKVVRFMRRQKELENKQLDACSEIKKDHAAEDQLSEDERDALTDEESVDEEAANNAELGGQATKTDNKTALTKEEKPVFNVTTFICYAGITRPITKYFPEEKLSLIEMEDVRKRLEKDHPELSKQRTKMDWDKRKNIIVPIVTGGKKGAYFIDGTRGYFSTAKELFENKESINIYATKDGFYDIRENTIGVFVAKTNATELQEWEMFNQFKAQLPSIEQLESCHEGFKLCLPKLPNSLFIQLVSFFMDYADQDVEVMGVFYWNNMEKRYLLDIPYQQVTKVLVDPCYTEFPQHFIKVAEVHSVCIVPRQSA